ncbi:TonB-dependent receptor plug domain-containing protein [Myxococcota bacterium]
MTTRTTIAILIVVLAVAGSVGAEESVSVAIRQAQPLSDSPSAVTVITREQIENTHCTDLPCLLRGAPGVDSRSLMPSYAMIGGRALTNPFFGNKTLVIIDGRAANNPLVGIPLWQILPVHLDDIERIEILRGPTSPVYGPDAHSLVVSIITRKIKDSSAEVFLGGGENDHTSLSARLGQRLGNFRFSLYGGYDTGGNWQGSGWREKEIGRVTFRADYDTSEGSSSFEAGLIFAKINIHTPMAPAEIPDTMFGHFLLSHRTGRIQAKLGFQMMDLGLDAKMPLAFGDIEFGSFPQGLHFFTANLDADVQSIWSPLAGNVLLAGVSYNWFTLFSENIDPELSYEHRIGAYLHDQQKLFDELVLAGTLRVDYNSLSPLAISPRLAVIWHFQKGQSLRLTGGRSLRKPCFFHTSTHVKGVESASGFEGLGKFIRDSVGNGDLDNESLLSFEAGYRGYFLDDSLVVEAEVFFQSYRDAIDIEVDMVMNTFGLPDFDASKVEFRNTGWEFDTVGGTLSAVYHLGEDYRFDANYTFRHSMFASGKREGDRLFWEPAHLANLSGSYVPDRGLRAGITLHLASPSKMYMPGQGSLFNESVWQENPTKFFFSGFLAWRVLAGRGWVEAGTRVINIFHSPLRDSQAVRLPDLSSMGGQWIGRQLFVFLRGSI